MAINTSTIATFINTITALTVADSCVPLMSNKDNKSNINNAGRLIIPWWVVPSIMAFSNGEWHHSNGIRPPSSLLAYSLQLIDTVAAPSAYSSTSAQPITQATISPIVAYA